MLDDLNIGDECTFYSWKHAAVVAAYKAGMNIYALIRQLRHTDLEYTLIYLKSPGLYDNEEFASKQPKF